MSKSGHGLFLAIEIKIGVSWKKSRGDSEGDVHDIAGCKRLVAIRTLPASRFIALFNACDAENVTTALDNRVFEVHTADVANGEGLHAHIL